MRPRCLGSQTYPPLNRLIVLERGRIAEDGTHDGLLQRGGIYASLWAQQSGGFLATNEAAMTLVGRVPLDPPRTR